MDHLELDQCYSTSLAIHRMLLADAIRSRGRSEASHPPRIIARVYRLLLNCSDYARIAKRRNSDWHDALICESTMLGSTVRVDRQIHGHA